MDDRGMEDDTEAALITMMGPGADVHEGQMGD